MIERWKEYLIEILNVGERKDAVITLMKMEVGIMRVNEEKQISENNAEHTIRRFKFVKSPGFDGITGKIIKYGSEELK